MSLSYLINGLGFRMIKNVMHFGKDHEMRKSRGTHQLPFPTVGRGFVFGNNLFAFIIGQINVLLLWQKILEFPYCQCYSAMCSSILKRKIITFLRWLIKTVEFLSVVIVNWMCVLTTFESTFLDLYSSLKINLKLHVIFFEKMLSTHAKHLLRRFKLLF